jgi:hypothetical protein
MSVAKKIFEIKKELSSIRRNADGYKFKYPTLTAIKEQLDDKLEAKGLVLIPSIQDITENIYTFIVEVIDTTDDDSLKLTFTVKGDNQQQNAVQSSGATMSYMQRYIPKLLFDLDFVDDDPDHKKNSAPKKQVKGVKTFKSQLINFAKENGITFNVVSDTLKSVANKTNASDLNKTEFEAVIKELKKIKGAK